MHQYILHDESITEAAARSLSAGQVGLMNGWGVFSTLHIIDGVMFAFERHWKRMERDARTMNVPFPAEPRELEEPLLKLITANKALNGTLRVVVVRNHGGFWEGPGTDREYDIIAFTNDDHHWGAGVKLGLVRDARHAASPFSGTKILSWSHNLVWLENAKKQGLDEVVLLNEHGLVSECTSANIFACFGNEILTPPLTSGCLPGVTRELLLEEIHAPGVRIGEKDLRLEDLSAADEVFITSTTRGLLPVLSISGLTVRNDGTARLPVQEAFQQYVASYVSGMKLRRT